MMQAFRNAAKPIMVLVAFTFFAWLVLDLSGITGGTSVLFNVTPGSASRLAFAIQPSNAVAGVAISPAVRVEARDASGNLVPSFNGNITVAISTNPGSSTLSGTVTRAGDRVLSQPQHGGVQIEPDRDRE